MLDVRAHVGKNCLYITVAGRLEEGRARELASLALHEMERLRPGFHVLSDVAYAEPFGEQALEQVHRLMRAAMARRLGGVVRVVGRSTRVALQLERLSRQLGYGAHLAYSREEAEQLLQRSRYLQHASSP